MERRHRPEGLIQSVAALLYALFCALITLNGPDPLALILLTPIVAYTAALGRLQLAVMMIVLAGIVPAVYSVTITPQPDAVMTLAEAPVTSVLWYVAIAAAGLTMGSAVRRQERFGTALAVSTGIAWTATGLHLALNWDHWIQKGAWANTLWQGQMTRGVATRDLPPDIVEQQREMAEALFVTYWPHVSVGLLFGMTVVVFALELWAGNTWLKWWRGMPGLRRTWLETRAPDWMAWVVVAVAAMGLVDDMAWPHPVLQAVSWNAGIALAAVYWVIGIAVLFYILRAISAHPIVYVAAVIMLVALPQMDLTLSVVGLFDTWADFRRRLDASLEARKNREEQGDDEW